MDPTNGYYTLQPNSPLIDAGTALYVVDGDTVINLSPDQYYGEAPDMGAYEYGEFNGMLGDLNQDGYILGDEPTDYELWAGDLNLDGNLDILDIVLIVNMILYG